MSALRIPGCITAAASTLLPWLAVIPLAAGPRTQDPPPVEVAVGTLRAQPDPYTREGGAAALAKAGYVSLGPFELGDNHTSKDVEALLGSEPLCWIETAHFRIGCALSPLGFRGANEEWAKRVRGELRRLQQRLPDVRPDTKVLDPWLRAHLFAQRCEESYAAFLGDLGVSDSVFPDAHGDDPEGPPNEFHGVGPYLGMAGKFAILIVQRTSSLARYTRAYQGQETIDPLRIHFAGSGVLGYAIAEETNKSLMKDDEALHTHLVYNLTVNFLNGYRGYGHELPPWLVLGLAHWHSRRVCPRYPAYERKIKDERLDSPFWQWDVRAQGLMQFGAFEPLAQLMARQEGTDFGMEQHIEAWYLTDFLMRTRKPALMRFLHGMKDPFHGRRKVPTWDEVLARQDSLLRAEFGMDATALEAAWRKDPLSTKRRK